jgi:hypothetical protein
MIGTRFRHGYTQVVVHPQEGVLYACGNKANLLKVDLAQEHVQVISQQDFLAQDITLEDANIVMINSEVFVSTSSELLRVNMETGTLEEHFPSRGYSSVTVTEKGQYTVPRLPVNWHPERSTRVRKYRINSSTTDVLYNLLLQHPR